MSNHSKKLLDQSDALTDFFESLMRDVEAYDEKNEPADVAGRLETQTNLDAATKPVVEVVSKTNLFETLPPVAPAVEEAEKVLPSITVPDAVKTDEAVKLEEITEISSIVSDEPAEFELPEWCHHDFQAMLFKVAGLTLAVPLTDLNGVVVCELEKVASMPGHADFYLGLLNYLDKNIPLVDTARFVLPAEKITSLTGGDPHARITRAVIINDCQYGLACDEVNDVITLTPDAVRWRTQRTRRRWLAGTVVEHMCALIDASAFAKLLAERASVHEFRQ